LNDVGTLGGLFGNEVPPPAAPAIANVGPPVLEPLIKFFRSSNDKLFVSASFLPVNSLIND
jgi:hypothetical protein